MARQKQPLPNKGVQRCCRLRENPADENRVLSETRRLSMRAVGYRRGPGCVYRVGKRTAWVTPRPAIQARLGSWAIPSKPPGCGLGLGPLMWSQAMDASSRPARLETSAAAPPPWRRSTRHPRSCSRPGCGARSSARGGVRRVPPERAPCPMAARPRSGGPRSSCRLFAAREPPADIGGSASCGLTRVVTSAIVSWR
jgi:hypothetical protein